MDLKCCYGSCLAFLMVLLELADSLQTTSVSGFYRIEVYLGEFENKNGLLKDGQSCDEVTHCDPVVYGFIDVERPLAPWSNAVTPGKLETITWRRNVNSYAINQTLTKDVCGGGLSNVNLRVEIMDEDFLGKYDLIEQFECKFFPAVADQPVNQFAADPDTFKSWTLMEECAAKHLPAKIRLFFRWRVYPVDMEECGKDPAAAKAKGPSVVFTTSAVTKKPDPQQPTSF